MSRLKTKVLVACAADSAEASRALLQLLHRLRAPELADLRSIRETLRGQEGSSLQYDALLGQLQDAVRRALPKGYYLSLERTTALGEVGYVLRRENEDELDVADNPAAARARRVERAGAAFDEDDEEQPRTTGLEPCDEDDEADDEIVDERGEASEDGATVPIGHHVPHLSFRPFDLHDTGGQHGTLVDWFGRASMQPRPAAPDQATIAKGRALVGSDYLETFVTSVRAALPYARQFALPDVADDLTILVIYCAWKESASALARGVATPQPIDRDFLLEAVRRAFVTHWCETARPDRQAFGYYERAAWMLAWSEGEIRQRFHDGLSAIRRVLSGAAERVSPSDLRGLALLDSDTAFVGDYLARSLSETPDHAIENRFRSDAAFFERYWGLVEGWQRASTWHRPVFQIAAVARRRLKEAVRSEQIAVRRRSAAGLGDAEVDSLWERFLAKVATARHESALRERRLLKAIAADYSSMRRAAVMTHPPEYPTILQRT